MYSDFRYYLRAQGIITTLFNLGFWSLILFRLGRRMYGKLIFKILLIWYLYLIIRNILVLISKIELPPSSKIGRQFNLVHAYGLVMGDNVTIGDNCTIGPWVVIGHNGRANNQPIIGNSVYIGAHACVLGEIRIGNYCLIGANTVVTRDVPDNSIVKNAPIMIKEK